MRSTAGVVDSVRCHHFVFEAFPEVFESVIFVLALEGENVLYNDFVSGSIYAQFKPWYSLESFLTRHFMGLGVQQVVDLLIVQLDILYCHSYFTRW